MRESIIWLHYFNNVLLEKGLITRVEWVRMSALITAKHVLKILIEVNWDNARDAILAASLQQQDEEQISESEK